MQSAHPAAEAGRLRLSGWMAVTTSAILIAAFAAPAIAQDEKPEASKPAVTYQTFFLHSATEEREAIEIMTVLRNELQRARVNYVSGENAICIQGTSEELAAAQKIVTDLDRSEPTWRLTYSITQMEDGKPTGAPEHAVLLVKAGSKTTFKQGSRVPVVTGSTSGDAAAIQVQYVDVGLNIEARIDGGGDLVALDTKLDQSAVAEDKSGIGSQDPVIRQTSLNATSSITEGKPVVLGSLDLAGTGKKEQIEVTAERLHE